MFLQEEFLEEEFSLNDELSSGENINENAATEWLAFYFKGTSEDVVERLVSQAAENITTSREADRKLDELDDAIDKIKQRGDKSHTIGNFLQVLFIPGGLIALLAKHLVKVYGYEGARDKSIALLKDHKEAIIRLKERKGW